MNPYIRKIVELHKIHEAIENKSNNEGGVMKMLADSI